MGVMVKSGKMDRSAQSNMHTQVEWTDMDNRKTEDEIVVQPLMFHSEILKGR